MKVFVVPVGSVGDVHPFIGLGKALKKRGYDVEVLASSYFEDIIVAAGLPFVSTETSADTVVVLENEDLWHPSKGVPLVAEAIYKPQMINGYNYIKENYEPGNTILLGPGWAFGCRLAQETLGIPYLTVNVAPSQFRSSIKPPKFGGLWMPDWLPIKVKDFMWWMVDLLVIDKALMPMLNSFRKELGLLPVNRIFHSWMNSPDGVIGLFPDWFGAPQVDWPQPNTLTGFPLYDESGERDSDSRLEAFLSEGEPPLVFTPGSAMKHCKSFFATSVDVCESLGKRGIFLTTHEEQIPKRLPKDILHFNFVPLSLVLPRSAAMIYHGGVGTCSQALLAGVPQLVMPMAFDQHDHAFQIEKMGVGLSVKPEKYTCDEVTNKITELLGSSEIKSNCMKYAELVKKHQPLELVCSSIDALAKKLA